MSDERDGGPRGWRPEDWLDGYGTIDPDGRFLDAQRAGIEAAASIVERMAASWASALRAQPEDWAAPWGTASASDDGPGHDRGAPGDDDTAARTAGQEPRAGHEDRDPLRDLRLEAVRSLDVAMDLTRRVVESSLDLADAALRRPHVATWATTGSTRGDTSAIELRAPAGGRTAATAWLHHVGPEVGPLTWRVLGPTTVDGGSVADVRVEPPEVAALHDGDRVELRVVAEVRDDAAPGPYHGLLLAVGAEETALVLRLVVTSSGST